MDVFHYALHALSIFGLVVMQSSRQMRAENQVQLNTTYKNS